MQINEIYQLMITSKHNHQRQSKLRSQEVVGLTPFMLYHTVCSMSQHPHNPQYIIVPLLVYDFPQDSQTLKAAIKSQPAMTKGIAHICKNNIIFAL